MHRGKKRKFGALVAKESGEAPEVHPELKQALLAKLLGGDGSGLEGPKVERIDNHIYFFADVDSDSILKLKKNLLEATREAQGEQIYYGLPEPPNIFLHIATLGGSLPDALGMADDIERNPGPITSICEGLVASAGTIISSAAHHRQITKHSKMLIHQLSSGFWGSMSDIEDEVKNLKMAMKDLYDFYSTRTKITKKQLEPILKHDLEWDSEKCLSVGLVDEII